NLSIRREPLDATLLDRARREGVHVLTSMVVTRVLIDDGRAVGVELADGTTVQASLVVGADGMRSMVAESVGAADRERHRGNRAIYYLYVDAMPAPDGGPADGVEFSLLGDELAYAFPSDTRLTCIAISINLEAYERIRHDATAGFEDLLRRHRGFWARY